MKHASAVQLIRPVTPENFDEAAYLDANPDVAAAVRNGVFKSGLDHYNRLGKNENRSTRAAAAGITALRKRKFAKLMPVLRDDLPRGQRGHAFDYLSDEFRKLSKIVDTSAVSSNNYDSATTDLIDRNADGLVLDCGAGSRSIYYENVVNFEIVAYETTDVLGVGEVLPFKDNSFDAVLSLAVLEHVSDPFRCAAEIVRVLKPGGELLCAVPFLQPLHGYPHHYYNMTHQGLKNLFDGKVRIESHVVPQSGLPIFSLTWMLNSWLAGLPEAAKREFLQCTVADLIDNPVRYLGRSFVQEVSDAANFELASMTMLHATKL